MPRLPSQHGQAPTGAKRHIGAAPVSEQRKWYRSREWTKVLRPACFERDLWTCQMEGCGINLGHRTSDLVADHIIPPRGIKALFFSLANLQTLCRWCHSRTKQLQEQDDK